MVSLIWTIVVVLFVLWLLGFALHFAGGLIHLFLVLAIIGIIYNLLVGSRAVLFDHVIARVWRGLFFCIGDREVIVSRWVTKTKQTCGICRIGCVEWTDWGWTW